MIEKFNENDMVSLRYKIFGSAIDKLIDSNDSLSMTLRVHLVSENILEELIRLIFEDKSQSILSLNLTYRQKLELVCKFNITNNRPILADYIVGSLRKLNSFRNKLAHNINFEISNDHVTELFMHPDYKPKSINDREPHLNIKYYAILILPEMLPIYQGSRESCV